MTEKKYEYILNPKTGKLVKTCGNIGMKLIKNYEYDEIYNPETKRTVNFNKTTGKKVYKKYEKYIEKYSKKGGSPALAACPTKITLRTCKKSQSSPNCSVRTLKRDPKQKNDSCRFILPKLNSREASSSGALSPPLNYDKTSNSALLYLDRSPEFSENLNENSYFVTYSYNNQNHIVSSSLNTINSKIVVEQYDYPPNPPNPPISTRKYQFDCEPSNANANKVCNSSAMQTNETLKKIFQILAAYIDTIVMLLNPHFLSIFTGEWLKNVVIEYIFNEILNLVIPYETNLVPIIVRSMMGDNLITISAKLTLKEFVPGYTANLPQVIIKKQVITLLEYVQKLNSKRQSKLNTEVLNTEVEIVEIVENIVNTISVNFGITVTEKQS